MHENFLHYLCNRNVNVNYSDIDVKLEFGEILRRDFEYQYKFRGPVVYAVLSF